MDWFEESSTQPIVMITRNGKVGTPRLALAREQLETLQGTVVFQLLRVIVARLRCQVTITVDICKLDILSAKGLHIDLNYSFECDWLTELSDNKLSNNKLSDNNLASELVKNRSFLNQSQSRKL